MLVKDHSKPYETQVQEGVLFHMSATTKVAPKFKSDLFTSDIRLKAANSTFITNKGECEISFKIGQEIFRFPFLCSDQLSQELILGHNFAQTFHIGTLWNANDVMSLTRNGKPFADTLHTE